MAGLVRYGQFYRSQNNILLYGTSRCSFIDFRRVAKMPPPPYLAENLIGLMNADEYKQASKCLLMIANFNNW